MRRPASGTNSNVTMLRILQNHSRAYFELAHRLATVIDEEQATADSRGAPPKVVVLWGGGKDSTMAVAVLHAVAELTPLSIVAVTMDNPGMSTETVANINRVVRFLNLRHEYRHFGEIVSGPGTRLMSWQILYRRLFSLLKSAPRFMCIACNFCAIVTEYVALNDHHATYLATGNPTWEVDLFEQWINSIKVIFPNAHFPVPSGNQSLDYYSFWHSVYLELIAELFPAARDDSRTGAEIRKKYLFEIPKSNSPASMSKQLPLLDDSQTKYSSDVCKGVLAEMGWVLPSDIQGGTESDCAFTSIIAHLNILGHGLDEHLADLEQASAKLRPSTEMKERAIAWARSGKSRDMGELLLAQILGPSPIELAESESPIAVALLQQLLKVR